MILENYLKQPLPFKEEATRYLDLKSGITIFEIGACEAEDTIKLRREFPRAEIYSFEPLQMNTQKHRENCKKYGIEDIKLFQLALSNKDGSATFYVSSGHPEDVPISKEWDYGNKSSSLLPPKETKNIHKWLNFDKQIEVKTQRIDSFCKEHSISKIDLIYLDVQGAELKVLEGAGEFLNHCDMVWLEVETVELYEGQPLKNSVETFMRNQGFVCIKDTVDEISGDQLYIQGKLADNKKMDPAI